jgi:phosphogluconate dehydratase
MVRKEIQQITDQIIERSKKSRAQYLKQVAQEAANKPRRADLACGNLAHAFASCADDEKLDLSGEQKANLAIISAYNDMLSAHKPYEKYPDLIRASAKKYGAVAQFAGGVPAMCDGVTQGQTGMELSLFSRDVIAMSASIALSHNMFDGVLCLGICDKIVPGLLIAALRFGHLPFVFVPGGPMTSGISNDQKAKVRQDYAKGLIGREELLKSESASYHSSGTCTFYGTANSNQMLMEIMGMHLPGASFVNPDTALRTRLTDHAVKQLTEITQLKENHTPIANIIDEKVIVNAIVGLHATGGSTNHTLHLMAIAKAAGINITWDDLANISEIVPLITRIYPNGKADINHFQAAGGMGFLMKELLDSGYLHEDVNTIIGKGLRQYIHEPTIERGRLEWKTAPEKSLDETVLTTTTNPFQSTGGLKLMQGNIGRAVIKVSAVAEANRIIEAPAVVFEDQDDIIEAFKKGELNKDTIIVLRYQGPAANGMPELHKLTPALSILQQKYKVALVTDGRMSGASGKIPAAIHLAPEALNGGIIAQIKNGDLISFNAETGALNCANIKEVEARKIAHPNLDKNNSGMGRELFEMFRKNVSGSESGATVFFN